MSAPARSYGGRSARERAADRRNRLVEATIDVLASTGERATMTAICSEAGLTERYFYESFPNRDAALVAALDQVTDEIATSAVRVLQDSSGTTEERVHAMTLGFAQWAAANPARARVAVVHANATAALRGRRHELIRSLGDLAAREAATLYGDRAWREDRARLHGLVYIGGLTELVTSWLTGEIELSTDELAETTANLFLEMLRGPESPAQA